MLSLRSPRSPGASRLWAFVAFAAVVPAATALGGGCTPPRATEPSAPPGPATSAAPAVVSSSSSSLAEPSPPSAPPSEAKTDDAALDAAVNRIATTCRWSAAYGYSPRYSGDCAGLKDFPEEPFVTLAARRALLASEDPRRRFLGAMGNGLRGLSVEEIVALVEKEPVPAVATELVHPLSSGIDMPPSVRSRAVALTFAEKLSEPVRLWLFAASERWLRDEPPEVQNAFRDRALREGAPSVKRRALTRLACAEVAPQLGSADDAEAERAIEVLLAKAGQSGCEPQLTSRAVAEAKKRGSTRLAGLEGYLQAAVVACSVSGGLPGARELGKAHAELARWMQSHLPPAKRKAKTKLGKELQAVSEDARRDALQATVDRCGDLARGLTGQAPLRGSRRRSGWHAVVFVGEPRTALKISFFGVRPAISEEDFPRQQHAPSGANQPLSSWPQRGAALALPPGASDDRAAIGVARALLGAWGSQAQKGATRKHR